MRVRPGFCVLVFLAAFGLGARATYATTIELTLTDGTNSVTVSDNAVGDTDPTAGVISFSGITLGDWVVNNVTATGSQFLSPPELMDVFSFDATATTGTTTTLQVLFTQYNHPLTKPGFALVFNGQMKNGSVTYNVYGNNANTPYAGALIGTNGPYTGSGTLTAFSGTTAGAGGTFNSLTQQIVIAPTLVNGNPVGQTIYKGDASLVPEPAELLLLSTALLGFAGVARRRLRRIPA